MVPLVIGGIGARRAVYLGGAPIPTTGTWLRGNYTKFLALRIFQKKNIQLEYTKTPKTRGWG